jgi:hypothetical protein
MRGVHEDGLIQRKRNIVVDNCAVDAAIVVCDTRLRETRDKFLDITNSLSSAGWLAGSRPIPKLQVLNEIGHHRHARVVD